MQAEEVKESASPASRDTALRRAVLRDVGGLALGAALASSGLAPIPAALAASGVFRASSQGSQVNKDPQSLLRLGLPIDCPAARAVQQQLEELRGNAAKSLWNKAVANAKSASNQFASKRAQLLAAVAPQNKAVAETLLDRLAVDLARLETVVDTAKLEDVLGAQSAAVSAIGEVEELMIAKFPFEIPPEYAGLPRLLGRATVEVTIKRAPDAEEQKFNVEGELRDLVVATLVVDGYNAPITAGNFVQLCSMGFYNGMQIQRADGFVVQTGDPRGIEAADPSKPVGYVQGGKVRNIPLEVFPSGASKPIYGSTFDEEGFGGAAATIPFQAYGALGMAREEYEADSASSQWFFLLFDSDLTPAGKNLLDGRYSCFGYTVNAAEALRPLRVGDIVVSTKILSGLDKLVV